MDPARFEPHGPCAWRLPAQGAMRVPAVIYADAGLLAAMDDTVGTQISHVASLPGIVQAAHAQSRPGHRIPTAADPSGTVASPRPPAP